jgi:hypothetical protein
MERDDRAALRAAVEAYERLTSGGMALTRRDAQRRQELLEEVRQLTGYKGRKGILKRARQIIAGIDPVQYMPRKLRYGDAPDVVPPPARPRPFDAPRVKRIISAPVESDRSRH